MRYKKFIIENYRAIKKPLSIDLKEKSLIPIIGVNECGKTTILHALLSFDYYNDKSNKEIKHLQDTTNLYESNPKAPIIKAEIEISKSDLKEIINEVINEEDVSDNLNTNLRLKDFDSLIIERNLQSKEYNIKGINNLNNANTNNLIAKKIISRLPYILYFDDFKDSVPDEIEIVNDEGSQSGWLAIVDTLFNSTDKHFSVFDLKDKEDRQRKSIISKVQRKLNDTLTKEWANFRLDDLGALEISINYHESKINEATRSLLKFDVVEKDTNGDEHYFYVRNRSKGFYWFFNFVMKLEFNPKVVDFEDTVNSIYVLDEPGSYLHALAQEKLCKKLKTLSSKNHVIYCTHSHHLLNPEIIPINNVKVAEKDGNGNVSLKAIYDHEGTINQRRTAYQPLYDALQLRPLAIDLNTSKNVLIVEGIIDKYLFELFTKSPTFIVLPSVGASSISYFISVMIAWRVPYRALWDDDDTGRRELNKAKEFFGNNEACNFFTLNKDNKKNNTIIQDLFDSEDIEMIKQALNIPRDTRFDKTISSLYYSPEKNSIIKSLTGSTKQNFQELLDQLKLN